MSEPYPVPPKMPTSFDESWRTLRIAAALVPFGLEPATAWWLHDVGISTLDDLSRWWQDKQTSELPGIRVATAREIDRCVGLFWAQWQETHEGAQS